MAGVAMRDFPVELFDIGGASVNLGGTRPVDPQTAFQSGACCMIRSAKFIALVAASSP